MKRPDIVHRISETIRRIAPNAQTILYGSEARGDASSNMGKYDYTIFY